MACRVCETDVPAAAFCGTCGAQLSAARGDGRGRLRLGAYAAARVSTRCGCRWSARSSRTCRIGRVRRFESALAILLLVMIAFGLLRWQAPLVAVGALGLPLMFLLYLYESDIDRRSADAVPWP